MKLTTAVHLFLPVSIVVVSGCSAREETKGVTGMNRLSSETSTYLLAHADNPVNWYPWGEEAFTAAEQEDKPIFLSVGYSSCHWCHVMEQESFEDPEVAALLNENYICIKVDREERPDIDNLYMRYTVAVTGGGGWPMTVIMTPGGKPSLRSDPHMTQSTVVLAVLRNFLLRTVCFFFSGTGKPQAILKRSKW